MDEATAPTAPSPAPDALTLWPPTQWRWTPVTAALGVFLVTRLALLLAATYGARATGIATMSRLLSGWDGQHYLNIAAYGYPSHPDVTHYSEIAFLPGYPLVVRFVKTLFGLSPLGGALLVSLVAGVALIVAVVRLVSLVVDPDAGQRAGIVLAVFPGSFVLSLPYAEVLALLFAVCAFLSLERGRAVRTGVFGALATFTSPVMIPVALVIALRGWRTRETRFIVAGVGAALGFLAYCAYLWHLTGNPRSWFLEQSEGFGHHFSLTAPIDHLHYWPGMGLTEVFSLVVMVLGFWGLRQMRAPLEWTVYAALVMGVILFDTSTWANPRFVLNAFPLLLGLAVWARREYFRAITLTFALLLPVVFLAYMTLGSVTAQP